MNLPAILLVALGGAIGASGRYVTVAAFTHLLGVGFPYGTLAVNVFGCLLMGITIGLLAHSGGSSSLRYFIATGILGGYTTFSAFSLETITMLERGETFQAVAYIALSVVLSLIALAAGLGLTRLLG